MLTQSGCFGSAPPVADVIDNVDEVSAMVDSIVSTEGGATGDVSPTDYTTALRLACVERRARLLTWAVAAIVAVMVLREIKD